MDVSLLLKQKTITGLDDFPNWQSQDAHPAAAFLPGGGNCAWACFSFPQMIVT
jgi:hypothetical protein